MLVQQPVCICYVVFAIWQVEGPSCICYPSLHIALWSNVPGENLFKILTVIIMLFTLLKKREARIKLSIMCSIS